MANATEQGAFILEALQEMQSHHPALRHGRVAGIGLMIGAELVLDEHRKEAQAVRNAVERHAIDNGLLILGAGFNTLRFCPPLMIERETVEAGLLRFERSLTQAEQDAGLH
jgi:4-aminobutyrate aminotransferase